MKLVITSITVPEVGELLNSVTTQLENRLRPSIEGCDYGGGIQQFAVFFVSVDSDPLENERYYLANNRASRYKDLITHAVIHKSDATGAQLKKPFTFNDLQLPL